MHLPTSKTKFLVVAKKPQKCKIVISSGKANEQASNFEYPNLKESDA